MAEAKEGDVPHIRVSPTVDDHDRRSRDLADNQRKFLIAINTGAITAMLATAGALANHRVNPGWLVKPMLWFVAGLVFTG